MRARLGKGQLGRADVPVQPRFSHWAKQVQHEFGRAGQCLFGYTDEIWSKVPSGGSWEGSRCANVECGLPVWGPLCTLPCIAAARRGQEIRTNAHTQGRENTTKTGARRNAVGGESRCRLKRVPAGKTATRVQPRAPKHEVRPGVSPFASVQVQVVGGVSAP